VRVRTLAQVYGLSRLAKKTEDVCVCGCCCGWFTSIAIKTAGDKKSIFTDGDKTKEHCINIPDNRILSTK